MSAGWLFGPLLGHKIVLDLLFTRIGKEAVFDPREQRVGGAAFFSWMHAANRHPVREFLNRDRVGFRNQRPDGLGELVGLKIKNGDNLERSQSDFAVKPK